MKAVSNPKPTYQDYCWFCGMPYAALHEVFGASDRGLSQYYGMQIRLCNAHHLSGKYAIHSNPNVRKLVQHYYRKNFIYWYPELEFNGTFRQNYEFLGEQIGRFKKALPFEIVSRIEELEKLETPQFGRYKDERIKI